LKFVITFGDAIFIEEGDDTFDEAIDLEEAGEDTEWPAFLRNARWNLRKFEKQGMFTLIMLIN
jgi:hypothetical protein